MQNFEISFQNFEIEKQNFENVFFKLNKFNNKFIFFYIKVNSLYSLSYPHKVSYFKIKVPSNGHVAFFLLQFFPPQIFLYKKQKPTSNYQNPSQNSQN